MRRHADSAGVHSSFVFLYNSFYDAAAHTIAWEPQKRQGQDVRAEEFCIFGKDKKGHSQRVDSALLGMDATRGSRELYRFFF